MNLMDMSIKWCIHYEIDMGKHLNPLDDIM